MTDTSLRCTVAALALVTASISSALAQTAQPLLLGRDGLFPLPAELVVENHNTPVFGDAVATLGNRAVVSMFASDTSTRLAIYERTTSGTWPRTGTIVTPTGFNLLGHSLALGPSRIFLGLATNEIHVFARSGNGWVFEQELFTPGQTDPRTPNLAFDQGWLITANREQNPVVSIFTRRNGAWSVFQSLDGGADFDFGDDFAIAGGILVVSSGEGVRIYRLSSNGFWTERQLITPPAGAVGFGRSVAVGNGLIAISAPFAHQDAPPTCGTAGASGAVYVYAPVGQLPASQSWALSQVVSHRSADCHYQFGSNVAVTGTHLAVTSAPFFNNYEVIAGKTVLYRRTPPGTFSIVGRDRGFFGGIALALSPTTMMVGVPGVMGLFEDPEFGGFVTMFDLATVTTVPQ